MRQAQAAGFDELFVAVDDPRLAVVVREAGGIAVHPEGEYHSGTDRIAAALLLLERQSGRAFAPDDIIVNVQGDEPFLEPELIRTVARALQHHPAGAAGRRIEMATAATPATPAEAADPHVVKVVLGADGCALYFSRAPIPHQASAGGEEPLLLRHLGIYAYRRAFLSRFVGWPPGRLEQIECLEQLRALERGIGIRVQIVATTSIGIDTPEDLARARARLNETAADGAPEAGGHLSERS